MNPLIIKKNLDSELEPRFKMKKILIFIIFIKCFFLSANAEIVYLDINYILKNSDVGKSLNSYIDELSKDKLITYKKIENDLIKAEKTILAQQNIINKNEFEKKLDNLSKKINKYKNDRKKTKDELSEIKINNTKKILKMLNPIITKYVEENSITLVLPKKNIIVGKKNLDITNQIIQILDSQPIQLDF